MDFMTTSKPLAADPDALKALAETAREEYEFYRTTLIGPGGDLERWTRVVVALLEKINKSMTRPQETTAPEYHPGFVSTLQRMLDLHKKKIQDYGNAEDLLANLRGSIEFGFPPEVGVFLRMADKMHRLQAFARKGKLANEGVDDTLIDIANYAVLALILIEERKTDAEREGKG